MGWLGFLLVGGGALTVWAGFEGVKITDVLAAVLSGQPVPRAATSGVEPSGATGKSGFDDKTKGGEGLGGGGGGSW